MTPALIASSSVRYSLTETLSLAARSVKKKLISMARSVCPLTTRIHAPRGACVDPGFRRGDGMQGARRPGAPVIPAKAGIHEHSRVDALGLHRLGRRLVALEPVE